MQFASEINNQDIVSDTRWLISGSSTGVTDYAINDLTRNVNRWYDKVVSMILRADGRWEWDDENYTTLPVATATLTSSQADYNIISTSFLNLIRVEVKDSSGNWIFLNPVSYEDKKGVAMTEWADTGTPQYYDKVGNSIILYPTPNYTSSAGLKVYYQRIASYFAVSDTTKTPGFTPIFHRLLSLGAAYDYCLLNGLNNKLTVLGNEITKMESSLIEYYSQRSRDEQPRIRLAKESYNLNDFGNGGENNVG